VHGEALWKPLTCAGHLESLLLAASGALEQLLAHHMISGKDAATAVCQAMSTLRSGSIPAVVGNTLHFGAPPVAAPSLGSAVASVKAGQHPRPPLPQASRKNAGGLRATPAAVPSAATTPVAVSPHPGFGVRALADLSNATPELLLVDSPGVNPVTLGPKPSAHASKGSTPVYHPPMRTGTSSVSNKGKSTIAATAKPTGLKALKEHQKELERSMKVG
jgi:hypothetical protein